MTSVFVDLIAGARPNFMKIASIINAIEERRRAGGGIEYRLVHTGQHYDKRMSDDFFRQLGIPEPHENFGVGSGTQAEQAGKIMIRYEALLMRQSPDVCVVVGDVTSTMACAIAASKMLVPVAHVEAGIRSWDWTMPEEVNRVVTDSVTRYFFTTSRQANANLKKAGVPADRVFFVGNTMIDTLLRHQDAFRQPHFWDARGLAAKAYVVLTLHRPSNVDDPAKLAALLTETCRAAETRPVVFPVHPRTASTLKAIGAAPANLVVVDPQPYLEFNFLVKHAAAVVTDSGGITEETTVMKVPCMTVRDSTERPETVDIGTNRLLGTDPSAIAPALKEALRGRWPAGRIPELWDGKAGERIVEVLERLPAL